MAIPETEPSRIVEPLVCNDHGAINVFADTVIVKVNPNDKSDITYTFTCTKGTMEGDIGEPHDVTTVATPEFAQHLVEDGAKNTYDGPVIPSVTSQHASMPNLTESDAQRLEKMSPDELDRHAQDELFKQ